MLGVRRRDTKAFNHDLIAWNAGSGWDGRTIRLSVYGSRAAGAEVEIFDLPVP
jgi:hypothetical protein